METGSAVFHPPGSLVLLGVDHGVLDGFVDQSINVRCEGVEGLRQSLTALGQKSLSFRVHAKLHLTETQKEGAPTFSDTNRPEQPVEYYAVSTACYFKENSF